MCQILILLQSVIQDFRFSIMHYNTNNNIGQKQTIAPTYFECFM